MVELLLMDETLPNNTALKLNFLETAISSWLHAQEGEMRASMATPKQLLTVFKLIKAEYDDKIARE